MPELPDVEVFKRRVDATSLHRRIAGVHLRREMVDGVSPQTIRRNVTGATLEETRRHGKYLFAAVDGRWLVLHFGMTGRLESGAAGEGSDHTELRLDFTDGTSLAYVSVRKLGSISMTVDPARFVEDKGLGPDLLALDREAFQSVLSGRRGRIKTALMNQAAVAGLGNIYADETLFQSGIHPERRVGDLTDDDWRRVRSTALRVVREAVERGADPGRFPRRWLIHRRDDGSPCPRCDGTIERIEVGGRATYHCPRHQAR